MKTIGEVHDKKSKTMQEPQRHNNRLTQNNYRNDNTSGS